jgi:hypothetical protein
MAGQSGKSFLTANHAKSLLDIVVADAPTYAGKRIPVIRGSNPNMTHQPPGGVVFAQLFRDLLYLYP